MIHNQHFEFYIASCHEEGGIYLCRFDGRKAEIIEKTPLDRPMYMVKSEGKLFALQRCAFSNGMSGALSFDINGGRLSGMTKPVSTNGMVACHLCVLDKEIYCVNYLSGSVAKINGATVTHSGKGIDEKRQDMPHTHYINSFDGKYLLCCDLGTDEIYTYDKELNEISCAKVPEGHGARHLAYKEGYVFCVNELKSTVSVFEYKNGILNYKSTVNALPEDCNVKNTAAAIRVNGDFVYVSNRGHNSITVLKLENGSLRFFDNVSCGGSSPRDFDIFGDLLICTNEESDNVTFFELHGAIPVKLDAELCIKAPLCVIE